MDPLSATYAVEGLLDKPTTPPSDAPAIGTYVVSPGHEKPNNASTAPDAHLSTGSAVIAPGDDEKFSKDDASIPNEDAEDESRLLHGRKVRRLLAIDAKNAHRCAALLGFHRHAARRAARCLIRHFLAASLLFCVLRRCARTRL